MHPLNAQWSEEQLEQSRKRRRRDRAESRFVPTGVPAGSAACLGRPADVPPGAESRRHLRKPSREESTTWLIVHFGTLLFIGLMGAAVFVLVRDLSGPAAQVSRVAAGAYVLFYGAGEAILGDCHWGARSAHQRRPRERASSSCRRNSGSMGRHALRRCGRHHWSGGMGGSHSRGSDRAASDRRAAGSLAGAGGVGDCRAAWAAHWTGGSPLFRWPRWC